MATIKPFQGIRYNLEKINDLSSVVTPPYDVISHQEQEAFYRKHPNNIIRLTKGKDDKKDNDNSNKYTRAASLFNEWCEKGILQREPKPAIYVYEQIFNIGAKSHSRKGFIANVKLEEFNTGHIYPHEQTLSGPKVDRFKLITACSANFSCIFSLYPDSNIENESVNSFLDSNTNTHPDISCIDGEGVKNNLWVINDIKIVDRISTLMKDKPLFIADGHHRYETALSYRNELRGTPNHRSSTDYVMMMCVSMNNSGLQILPTHRVVKDVNGLNDIQVLDKLREVFDVQPVDIGGATNLITEKLKENIGHHSFIIYLKTDKKFYLIKLIDEKLQSMDLDLAYSKWKYFDVGILHGIVFDKLLGLDNDLGTNEKKIEYVKEESDAISMVNDGEFQFAVFLNPTKIEDIRMVAQEQQIMPPKSTYFYPKLVTGMVINKL
ncbi:MAG: DUF1015 domain-containing protein [Candidatus Anammoxibacter sp.]